MLRSAPSTLDEQIDFHEERLLTFTARVAEEGRSTALCEFISGEIDRLSALAASVPHQRTHITSVIATYQALRAAILN
jgi:hypothetical protein